MKIYKKEYENLPIRFQNKIAHDLDYLIKARIPGLKKVYLFGSCARGEVRSTSDVDLLILTEKRITDRTLSAMIRWTLDEDIEGIRTDVVYTYENAEFGSQTFQREISRDKKLLLEVVE
ncbi:MAG TPA: nucleotidyltransferase domain-containing protein [Candidatus Blautia excrementigallinarum]|nr:nucleotidyltransferase domain-containing protein [Candidatus Blautia excrementigallinarum]